MRAQLKYSFKYAFREGLAVRGITFAVIAGMMLVFGIFTSTVTAWEGLKITAVSLGGCAIAAMIGINIVSDVAISRRLFAAPGAYLYALTPAHRGKMLASNIITMMILDIVTLTVVITGEVWLSMILAGENAWRALSDAIGTFANPLSLVIDITWSVLGIVTVYLLAVSFIMYCVTVRRSLFYQKRAGGFLTFLSGCATLYVIHLLPLLLAPFNAVRRHWGLMIDITLTNTASMFAYVLLNLLAAVGLFLLTARLMERKINL